MSMAVDLGTVADLPTKYQKLASEYSKMRAQVAVLKKAVFDEQSKVSELKDILKERDHTIRKNDQEMESLQFRNQQLARRVSVLQDELNGMQQKNQGKSKKGTGDSVQAQIANSILGEELQQKIEENARLHQQVYEADFQHQKDVNQLQERLSELEKSVKSHDSVVEDVNKRNKILIEKLQQEKLLFEYKLLATEKNANESSTRAEDLQEQLSITQELLGDKLEKAYSLIRTHLHFIDSRISSINSINVPRCSGRVRKNCGQLVTQAAEIIFDIIRNLSNYHTYFEQRSIICNSEESTSGSNSISKKLSDHLHENSIYLKQLEHSYQELVSSLQNDIFIAVEMTSPFEDFASNLNSYILYLKKISPYLILSYEEENKFSWLPTEIKKKNELILDGWHNFIAAFSKVNTYCQLLISNHTSSVKNRAILGITTAVSEILNSVKAICSHFNGKVIILKELPIISEKLKTTDECILASLVSLVASFKKLYSVLFESMNGILEEHKCHPFCDSFNSKSKAKLISNFKKKAANYISSLDEGPNDFIPYSEAIKNKNLLHYSVASRDSMDTQLTETKDKISKLEQLKEFWMLEYQLLRVKHEKFQKKFQQDLDTVSVGSEKTVSPNGELNASSPMVSSSLLAKLELEVGIENCEISEYIESEDIRQYFVRRINDLVCKRQLADSKAVSFHSEVTALQRRIFAADKEKADLLIQVQETNEAVTKLKEELQTTTTNYKVQLSTMSEHLANMNDKLTTQKDEIDDLRFALNNTGNRKTKGK